MQGSEVQKQRPQEFLWMLWFDEKVYLINQVVNQRNILCIDDESRCKLQLQYYHKPFCFKWSAPLWYKELEFQFISILFRLGFILTRLKMKTVILKVLRKVLPDLCYDFICWQRLRDFQNIHLDTHGVMKYLF